MGLKFLGRVGTHIFLIIVFLEKNIILCILKGISENLNLKGYTLKYLDFEERFVLICKCYVFVNTVYIFKDLGAMCFGEKALG